MADINTIDAALETAIIGQDSTGIRTNPVNATTWGLQVDPSGVYSPVKVYDPQTLAASNVTNKREFRVAEPKKLLGDIQDGTTLDTNYWIATLVGSGAATAGNAIVSLSTGATSNSTVLLQSVKKARYVVGTVNAFSAGIRLGDTGAANNVRRWGAYSSSHGVFFQLNGTTVQIGIRFAGTDTLISSFNGPNSFVLDTNFHSYEIQYTQDGALFFQDSLLIHTYKVTTTALSDSMHFRISFENNNSGGSTSNLSLYVAAPAIIRYGADNVAPTWFHSNFLGRVQANSAATTTNANTLSVNINPTTAGDAIIVAVAIKANPISTITDNLGQTYTLASSISVGGSGLSYIYYVLNTGEGVTTITVTLGALVSDTIVLTAAEYSGISTSGALDKTSTNANTSTSWTSGLTATTSQANELLFGSAYDSQNSTTILTPGTGYTTVNSEPGSSVLLFTEDQIVTSTGTYAATGSSSKPDHIYAMIATFTLNTSAGALFVNKPVILKYSPGKLHRLTLNSIGISGSKLFIYDSNSTLTNLVGIFAMDSALEDYALNIELSNGLLIVATSNSADFTITYE